MEKMSHFFVGVALPRGVNKLPKGDLEELLHFTRDQTRILQIERGTPIFWEHEYDMPIPRPIGEVLRSFDFPGGEKGVIGRFDTNNPSGRYFVQRHLLTEGGARALSLGHRQTKVSKKKGERTELGDRVFPKDGKEIIKRVDHLSACEVPAREGCRILYSFAEADYKKGDPEKWLWDSIHSRNPAQVEAMSEVPAATPPPSEAAPPQPKEPMDPVGERGLAYAKMATLKKEDLMALNFTLQEKYEKAMDEMADASETKKEADGIIETNKKMGEQNEYFKKLIQDTFESTMTKNLDRFAKLTDQTEEEKKSLSNAFTKGLNPWTPDADTDKNESPIYAQNALEQMVLASEKTIQELRGELATARGEIVSQNATTLSTFGEAPSLPLKRKPDSSSSSSSAPLKRRSLLDDLRRY